MGVPERKLDLKQQAHMNFKNAIAIKEMTRQLNLNETEIQRRQQKLRETQKFITEANETNAKNEALLKRRGIQQEMLSADNENMKITLKFIRDTLDGVHENVEQMKQTFKKVFVNFNLSKLNTDQSNNFVIALSKKLFHGNFLERGVLREKNIGAGWTAFKKNVSSPTKKRYYIAPIFRYKELEKTISGIQIACLRAFYNCNAPMSLIEMAKDGNLEKMQFYLAIGVDLNLRDKNGDTALHWATRNNKVDAVVLLMNNGGNWELKNKKKQTPKDLAPYTLRAAVEFAMKKAKPVSDSQENSDNNNNLSRSFNS